MKYKIAIIISCYNEEKNVEKIYDRIIEELYKSKKIKDYQMYFINDVSKDNTKNNINKLVKKDKKVTLIDFKKRTGKSVGLQVGFNQIPKDIDLVFMMDADLQDDPKEIDRFIEKIESGYDLVSGYKKKRLDNLEKRTASKVYNKILNLIFKMNLHDHNCGFKCFKRKDLNDLKIYDNLHRYITILINSQGYKVGEIEVEHHKRIYGKSKYGLSRYFIGFKDMIRIKFIITHQKKNNLIFDFIISLLILVSSFYINKVLFATLFVIIMILYIILLVNLNKYNKFNIEEYKNVYKIINSKN